MMTVANWHKSLINTIILVYYRHSGIPNIGRKTLWGLSGLEILDLSHNSLSNVIEPNFDGLYSLKELYLDNNHIKSIVSAAFRHASRLQILSLANNRLEGIQNFIFHYYKVCFQSAIMDRSSTYLSVFFFFIDLLSNSSFISLFSILLIIFF